VVARCELAAAQARPEPTGRRSITFSPQHGARVVLTERRPVPSAPRDLIAAA
jgi:hypothetical protein